MYVCMIISKKPKDMKNKFEEIYENGKDNQISNEDLNTLTKNYDINDIIIDIKLNESQLDFIIEKFGNKVKTEFEWRRLIQDDGFELKKFE